MFSVDEIARSKFRGRNARQNDQLESNMPYRTTRDKRNLSRLNLAGDKANGIHRSLSSVEEEFIYAAEFGDIPSVKRILDENLTFNVDYSDIIGRTPLRLAVGNEHLEVVELLLDRSNLANIHEALLQAISAGHEQIAETILKHPKYRDVKRDNKRFGETDYFFNTTNEDSPFSADITPLILAAERNQFEIIQLLLLRGENINKPHHYYCNCQECSNKIQFDQWRLAKTRLNAYRGLASSAYISLSSKDPILTAFELARELRGVAKVEKYYKNEYLGLADQLSVYVVKLLDKVRGHDELEKLLNKKGPDCEDDTYELLARLKLAIHYNEKKFVAHPSCQQKLVSIWYDDLRSLERSNWFFRSMMVISITLCYPVLAILYWFIPKSKFGKLMRYPCVKFIGHTMSFITFLVMILISSITAQPATQHKIRAFENICDNYESFQMNRSSEYPTDFVVRISKPEIIHLMLSLWIIGMLWQEVKQVYSAGIYDYFDSLYNYLDVAVLTLYITSFTLRYITIMKVNMALTFFSNSASWIALANEENGAKSQMYWLIADRSYWSAWDPHNIAEGLFALANVISFTRVSYVLPANELFGPMQISLAKMISDILKFGVIFLVVFLAFMVGLHNLYWYYPKEMRKHVVFMKNSVNSEDTLAGQYFGIPHITFRTVFWSLFGRGETTAVELGEFGHIFTQTVGYWIFGAYNIATVTVLLNMLIAMMSRSFEIIQGEADTEWKFARSKLYMEYIKDDATLPIPFNIVPTPKFFYNTASYCWRTFAKKDEQDEPHPIHPGRVKDIEMFNMSPGSTNSSQAAPQPKPPERRGAAWSQNSRASNHTKGIKVFQDRIHTTNGFVRNDSDPSLFAEKLTYKRVMKRIVKRYIFDVQREDDSGECDFDEIKQDISSFRYEMLNHLSQRQRESKDTYERVDNLEYKIDTLIQQQTMWLKALSKSDSDFKFTNFMDPKGISKAATVSQESAIYDCNEETNEELGDSDKKSNVGVLHDIPEEEKPTVATEHKLQRQRADCDTEELDTKERDTEDISVEVVIDGENNCDIVDERL
ncbi:short transient receptor potential channel 7-like isoform X2 [Argopecten irradians]|uniref:short transient receptor potential channel 7-like isoform X2 n=1 Tax=Argopecten irradians TaxID=31199 RepID=UPI00371FE46D